MISASFTGQGTLDLKDASPGNGAVDLAISAAEILQHRRRGRSRETEIDDQVLRGPHQIDGRRNGTVTIAGRNRRPRIGLVDRTADSDRRSVAAAAGDTHRPGNVLKGHRVTEAEVPRKARIVRSEDSAGIRDIYGHSAGENGASALLNPNARPQEGIGSRIRDKRLCRCRTNRRKCECRDNGSK